MDMSMSPTVTRTYRAAVRLGEDFITVEETITLPAGAGPDEVDQAVALGLRIFQAQQTAVAAQVASIRETTPPTPPPPATDKQRNYLAKLQDDLGWTSDQTIACAAEYGVDLVTMDRDQASRLIDVMKRTLEGRSANGGGGASGGFARTSGTDRRMPN